MKNPSYSQTECGQLLDNYIHRHDDHGAALLSMLKHYIKHCSFRHYPLDEDDQQDILQEAAIKILLKYEQLQHDCTAWLFTIVRNEYFNHLRKLQPQLKLTVSNNNHNNEQSPAWLPNILGQAQKYPDYESLEQFECLESIFDTIAAQETGDADMQIYTEFAKGYSHADIAEHTGRSTNAIGKRLSILRSRIKSLRQQLC